MNHRKAKELIPPVAQEMNLPLELAEDLISYYWDTINKSLASLDHLHVTVQCLGTFHIKSTYCIEDEIEKLSAKIKLSRYNDAKNYPLILKTEVRIEKLEKLHKAYHNDISNRAKNHELRRQIRDNNEQNMDQQETDPGGIN